MPIASLTPALEPTLLDQSPISRRIAGSYSGRQEKPLTVVVIDDDLGVRRGLARLLRASGFEAETYASADAFLDRPAGDAGICLVLDIHLGGMSGLELADRLDEQGRSVPIVFISAQDGSLPAQRNSRSGTIAFLRKPFDESLLIEAVSRGLGLASRH